MGLLSRIASVFSSKPKPQKLGRPDLAAIVALVRSQESARIRREYTRKSENWNGIIQRQVGVRLRWSPADVERILDLCNAGDLFSLGLFLDFMRSDGTVYGLMSTRTSLLRLPLQWSGDPLLVEQLQGVDPTYDPNTGALLDPGLGSEFQRLFPLDALGAILWDGDLGGIGVGEFHPQTGRLRHLNIHWLRYEWDADRWIYQSPIETYEIRPGDGRWFFYTPYGSSEPWSRAPWLACALDVIAKQTAKLDRLRWQGDYADALKVVMVDKDRPNEDVDKLEAFARDDWKRSPFLILRGGEDAKLVEGSGRGYDVYSATEKSADDAIAKALAGGQTVTSSGTTGWSKGSIWQDIAYSIVQTSAERLAETIREQGLKPFARSWNRPPFIWVRWDVRPPEQKVADAEAYGKLADSISKTLTLDQLLKEEGKAISVVGLIEQLGFALPMEQLAAPEDPMALSEGDVIDAEFEEIPVELDELEDQPRYGELQ